MQYSYLFKQLQLQMNPDHTKGSILNTYFMPKPSNLPKTPSWVLQFLVDANKVSKKPPISPACVNSRGLYEDKINPKLIKKLKKNT